MKYSLMIRSRPTEDILKRHDRFMTLLSGLRNEWGLSEGADVPTVKDPGTDSRREVNLSKYFHKGIHAIISYQNRKYLEDRARFDDYFTMEFAPSKFDYALLCMDIFMRYVESFGAYYGEIGDEELIYLDFDRKRKIEARNAVYRIYPVCFFDRQLCDKGFHLTPEEIARRVAASVEKASNSSNGIHVVASSKIVSIEESNTIDMKLKNLLAKREA